MDRVRPSLIEVLHFVKDRRSVTRILAQEPSGAAADFMGDFGVGSAVVVHQHDLGRHSQIKGAIDGMHREPRASEPIDCPCQTVAFGKGRQLAKCSFDGLNVSGKGYDRVR